MGHFIGLLVQTMEGDTICFFAKVPGGLLFRGGDEVSTKK